TQMTAKFDQQGVVHLLANVIAKEAPPTTLNWTIQWFDPETGLCGFSTIASAPPSTNYVESFSWFAADLGASPSPVKANVISIHKRDGPFGTTDTGQTALAPIEGWLLPNGFINPSFATKPREILAIAPGPDHCGSFYWRAAPLRLSGGVTL